jgi:mannose-1-phosphate guanylyltransferase/mannose-1-phosphate guanylyltransferase/mannose-6-phosphate isomerase
MASSIENERLFPSFLPAILSGGSGTRLWPDSRTQYPKQFSDLFGESLILRTVARLLPFGSPWVITTRAMATLTQRLFREQGLRDEQILLEPQGRNTAAAVGLLCRALELSGRNSQVVGVFPADHFIENLTEFGEAASLAESAARAGAVVTLGITPTHPATGYGYIELGTRQIHAQNSASALSAVPALGFREKPDASTARSYLESGRFVWNAGIFFFRVDRMITHFERYLPEAWTALRELRSDFSNLDSVYRSIPPTSLDHGIIEKIGGNRASPGSEAELLCVPCENLGWSDVGSWEEAARIIPRDESRITEVEGTGNFVASRVPAKQYAFVGTNDLIVADTADALLVLRKGHGQAVREAQARLAEKGVAAATTHSFELRPWGEFEILRDSPDFKAKVIRVEPGQQLSYQSHSRRAEHWVVVRGEPEVVLDDKVLRPRPGEHVHIPLGAKHRMRNPGTEVVEFVEIQVGSYFGEDDIVRYQDDYQRT